MARDLPAPDPGPPALSRPMAGMGSSTPPMEGCGGAGEQVAHWLWGAGLAGRGEPSVGLNGWRIRGLKPLGPFRWGDYVIYFWRKLFMFPLL